jgi:hypothetical protein
VLWYYRFLAGQFSVGGISVNCWNDCICRDYPVHELDTNAFLKQNQETDAGWDVQDVETLEQFDIRLYRESQKSPSLQTFDRLQKSKEISKLSRSNRVP